MAITSTKNESTQSDLNRFDLNAAEHESTQNRLEILLKANAETKTKKRLFAGKNERFEAEMMSQPLTTEKAFSYFGLMLGAFPPAAIFLKYLVESRAMYSDDAWIIGILLIVNIVTAVVGFFSGKLVGRIVSQMEMHSWHAMLLVMPFVGFAWGLAAGAAGGFVIFIVGALFGACLGGIVGAAALPVFTIFHRILKRGDVIETKHFLPLAFGITLSICSFILGL